jgi:hypothetical protein
VTPAQFACLWRKEVRDARALGRRVGPARYHEARYEHLVAEPEAAIRDVCAFAELPYEPAMLDYTGAVDVSAKPHQQRLLTPPKPGVRSWRAEMSEEDVTAFEQVAGDLLGELGYEVGRDVVPPGPRARLQRGWYDVRLAAWNVAAAGVQRSPLWRRRHPRLSA